MEGTRGGRVLSFQEKRKNQRKADWSFLPIAFLSSGVLGELYIGRCVCLLSPLARSKSQRRFLLPSFMAHAFYYLLRFGFPRMYAFYLDSFRPRLVRRPSAAQTVARR